MKPGELGPDDEQWVEELAGRHGSGPHVAARAEARALRKALKAREARHEPESDAGATVAANLGRETSLIDRARAEGLLVRAPRRMPWLAAAAVAVLAVGIGLQMRSMRPSDAPAIETRPPVERAGAAATIRLVSDVPLALKLQLLAELRAAGIDARGYESLGVQAIDAELPATPTEQVLQILRSHGIPVPPDGVLLIEIVDREVAAGSK